MDQERIEQRICEYEAQPEPKMDKDIFYALMKCYEQYGEALRNLKDR